MKKIFLPVVMLHLAGMLHAQAVVDPDAAQKKVLDKAIPRIIQVLDQFNGRDWELTSDFYNGKPLIGLSSGVPLDIDQNFERQYKTAENSERFNRLLKPIYDRINELMKQQPAPYDSILALGDKMESLSNITVYVYINRENLETHPDPKKDLSIPGAAFAHRDTGQYFQSEKGYSYYLGFGNWKAATWDAAHGWLHFNFIHPRHTPYIENIVVIFFGADDRVKELLNKVDWKILNDALTI